MRQLIKSCQCRIPATLLSPLSSACLVTRGRGTYSKVSLFAARTLPRNSRPFLSEERSLRRLSKGSDRSSQLAKGWNKERVNGSSRLQLWSTFASQTIVKFSQWWFVPSRRILVQLVVTNESNLRAFFQNVRRQPTWTFILYHVAQLLKTAYCSTVFDVHNTNIIFAEQNAGRIHVLGNYY